MHVAKDEIKDKMRAVYKLAQKSPDRSTKNGAIICDQGWNVIGGFNHFVPGYGHLEAHHERPLKYEITEHAERDVILKAAKQGVSLKGLTLVANWVACPDCARAIALSGIKHVICHKECMDKTPERWMERVNLGLSIMENSGVEIIKWSGKVGVTGHMNGEVWYP